jgi:hypothetical protein
MDTSNVNDSLVIPSSPIEFVVIGPQGKREGVLVRSENVEIDLVGFAADGRPKLERLSDPFSRLFFTSSRTMNSIGSFPIHHRDDKWDDRKAGYRFCWVGLCSDSDQGKIHEIFNRYVADLQNGIEERNVGQVEWSLAPVILHCLEAHRRLKKRKHFRLFLGAIYLIAFLIYGIVYYTKLVMR